MKNGRFEVGDKVRLVRVRPNDSTNTPVGAVGSLVDVRQGGGLYDYAVEFEKHGRDLVYNDEIELVVDAKPTFKVGDRVRLTKRGEALAREHWYHDVGIVEGVTGTIVDFAGPKERPVMVEWNIDDLYKRWCVPYESLELIAPPAPSYAVGDKVRILPTTKTSVEERVHAIVAISVWNGKPRISVVPSELGHVVHYYLDEIEPYVPSPVVWKRRDDIAHVAHIDQATIDEWVREGREWRKANPGVEGDWSKSSGDAKMFVDDDGTAKLYRLEAISDGE